MTKPKMPIGKISGDDLIKFQEDGIEYHIKMFKETIAEYEPSYLYSHWRTLVRSIDEIINIPFELKNDTDKSLYLSLDFDFFNQNNLPPFAKTVETIEKQFGDKVAMRFKQTALMCGAIDKSYKTNGIYDLQGNNLSLSSSKKSIDYFQSRRIYYVTILSLIPAIAEGKKTFDYIDTLNFLQYTLDSCLVGITTSYYNLLVNECLSDYELISDGEKAKGNYNYAHLENFFLEPERLSLLDQLELRKDIVNDQKLVPKSTNKIFSFSEVANTMLLFEGAFDKYKIKKTKEFIALNSFFYEIAIFINDDFNVIIDSDSFNKLLAKYPLLALSKTTTNYFEALNSYSPFQKHEDNYYSTVVMLIRLAYRTLSKSLLKNRSFQINSGFVFEDKVSKLLESNGFKLTDITRINRKEFDVITIRNSKIYNFQCKNNFIDISRVDYNYKLIGRFNNQLCRYYEKALIKEENREHLIIKKLGIKEIEHFVISRFPVITRNERIINFRNLEETIKTAGNILFIP